jgi:predicted nucleotide-binding protein
MSQVFVVHGHDTTMRDSVAGYLEHLGLTPVILMREASGGATIVEKLEQYAAVCEYAVCLISADDMGCAATDYSHGVESAFANYGLAAERFTGISYALAQRLPQADLRAAKDIILTTLFALQSSRPRQNVILETGYFLGRLGRRRVCLLVKPAQPIAPPASQFAPRLSEMELPSDLDGIVTIPYISGWERHLAGELRHIGVLTI